MTFQKSIGTKLTLLGLAAAFLYSALVLPVSNTELEKTRDRHVTLVQSSSHASPNAPVPLPGEKEEEEEENRTEKDSKFIASFLISSVEFSIGLRIVLDKNHWQYSRLAPASSTPLYILKNSFQI